MSAHPIMWVGDNPGIRLYRFVWHRYHLSICLGCILRPDIPNYSTQCSIAIEGLLPSARPGPSLLRSERVREQSTLFSNESSGDKDWTVLLLDYPCRWHIFPCCFSLLLLRLPFRSLTVSVCKTCIASLTRLSVSRLQFHYLYSVSILSSMMMCFLRRNNFGQQSTGAGKKNACALSNWQHN